MAVRWFFHQTDERRIKAHSLGSAAPLQKEEGLNSFGLATILINNSIPHSYRERERETVKDRRTDWLTEEREGEGVPALCGSISLFSCTLFLQHPAFTDSQLFVFFYIQPSPTLTELSPFSPVSLPDFTLHCCPLSSAPCVPCFSKAVGLGRTFPWIKRMISLASTGVRFQSRD